MIFKNFCEREMIDPPSFLKFCLNSHVSGWQIVNDTEKLEMAWKTFLALEYLHMLARLEEN